MPQPSSSFNTGSQDKTVDYNDRVSPEMEHLTLSVEAGVTSSSAALQQTIGQ